MTDPGGFDLNPPAPPGGDEAPASAAPTPRRGRFGRKPARTERAPPADEGAARSPGWARALRWVAQVFVSERAYYFIGFALTAALLLLRFNPEFGEGRFGPALAWPWELFQGADGGFELNWGPSQITVLILLGLALGYLTAFFLPRGRARGVWALLLSAAAFTVFAEGPAMIRFFLLNVASALVVGALLWRAGGAPDTGRRFLVFAVCFLGSFLLLPLSSQQLERGRTETSVYKNVVVGLIDVYADPPQGDPDNPDPMSRAEVFLRSIPQTVAVVLFVVALLVLLGVRGTWPRWVAGVSLILLLAGLSVHEYFRGMDDVMGTPGAEPMHRGLHSLGSLWILRFVPFLPALAAGIADMRWQDEDEA